MVIRKESVWNMPEDVLTCTYTDAQGNRLGEIRLFTCTVDTNEEGEAIFRDDGVGGIAIMQLSLGAKKRLLSGEKLFLRLCPGGGRPLDELKARLDRFPVRALSDVFTGELNRFIANKNFYQRNDVSAAETAIAYFGL